MHEDVQAASPSCCFCVLLLRSAADGFSPVSNISHLLQVEVGVSAVKKDYYRALRNFVALLPAQIPVDLEFLLP